MKNILNIRVISNKIFHVSQMLAERRMIVKNADSFDFVPYDDGAPIVVNRGGRTLVKGLFKMVKHIGIWP